MTPRTPSDGRTRRRFASMRAVQAAGLDLFERRGFDEVTVEDVARAAGVGAASVYRNFGTKERVVLWDEYDPMLFEALAARLQAGADVLAVVRESLVASLDRFYAADAGRILRRSRLVSLSESLRVASAADLQLLRQNLATLFRTSGAAPDVLSANVAAGVVTACLESAAQAWVASAGRRRLASLLENAFDAAARLSRPPPVAARRARSATRTSRGSRAASVRSESP